ncbi:hypothetical protein A9F05_15415 (plasmid) [Lactiplantibacillus plantarum]|nr:hypothetical protein A9F05_15415 [Lactiplantibacillus plantarum]
MLTNNRQKQIGMIQKKIILIDHYQAESVSYQMSPMITDDVNKGAQINGDNIDYAFDLNEFFATNQNGHFIHEMDIKKWLDTLTHNEKYPFSTKELRDKLKHTFWLLNRVASAKALENY